MRKKSEKLTATSGSKPDQARDWNLLIDEIKASNAGRSREEIETIIDEALAWARGAKARE